ncbi:hypothetical protein NW755_005549 [Fusarium falciforme]|uniref:Uncharacterized protein n=1 Tax=Fusarium falciforme TaxID=195108 RepID=A0A9W8R925_9HYPO|nr:hypothetical protein NW755_005549 [Fusarium falciforme]
MKAQNLLVPLFAGAALADHHPGAKEKCGRLGVMEWDPAELPDGVTPDMIRMCADHPMGMGNYWGWGEYMPDWVPVNPLVHLLEWWYGDHDGNDGGDDGEIELELDLDLDL